MKNLLFLILMLPMLTFSQETIEGIITEKVDGNKMFPLAGANVFWLDTSVGAVTDIDGKETEEKISFLNNAMRHFAIGAEIFPKGSFNIRLGYNFRRSKELQLIDKRTFSGFTGGFGIKMKKFKFNYAFSKFHTASNSSTFSLQINLN